MKALVLVAAVAGTAWADAPARAPTLLTVPIDHGALAPEAITDGSLAGSTLYLNQCVGGCVIHVGSADDSGTDTSAIPKELSMLPAYAGWQDGEWAAVVKCVQDVYSPYNLTVTDARPPAGSTYAMIDVAGSASDLQITQQGVGGIALLARDCTPSSQRGVAFAFTDQIAVFANEDGSRVGGMCWIIAQESAHVFGLDHEYAWADDDTSACSDPMTYRDDCGGTKFFRNRYAHCGELSGARAKCGPKQECRATQNSHTQLLGLFGAREPSYAVPVADLVEPAVSGGLVTAGMPVVAMAQSPRGVDHVALYINGFPWGDPVPGAPIGKTGQPESAYTIAIPAGVPDSVLDVQMVAFDDLGAAGASATVRVTKGAACTDASTCAKGQDCDGEGRCAWGPPTGATGDACTYDELCTSGMCDDGHCTHACALDDPADPQACEGGETCVARAGADGPNATVGTCKLAAGGGCCSGSGGGATAAFGAFAIALALVRRRRR